MRSKAIERAIASDMAKPNAMGGPAQPSDATTAGLKLGNGVGDNNRERSFLERLSQSGLSRYTRDATCREHVWR